MYIPNMFSKIGDPKFRDFDFINFKEFYVIHIMCL